MDDRLAVGAVLDLAGLRLADRLLDVVGDGADLRVRHLALRAEDAAELADRPHHLRGRDRDVEVGPALFDFLGQVVAADEVRAGRLGVAGLLALGEDGDGDVLAQPVGQGEGAAQLFLGVADVEAEQQVQLDRLVEVGARGLLDQRDASAGG